MIAKFGHQNQIWKCRVCAHGLVCCQANDCSRRAWTSEMRRKENQLEIENKTKSILFLLILCSPACIPSCPDADETPEYPSNGKVIFAHSNCGAWWIRSGECELCIKNKKSPGWPQLFNISIVLSTGACF